MSSSPVVYGWSAMSKADVARVLTLAATFDQRTASKADVEAWHQVAVAFRWRPEWAARVIIEHYGVNTDQRIMPGHITRRIRQQLAHFASTYRRQPIPAHVRGVNAEIDWENARTNEHVQACMNAWATGEDVDR